jgi:hypothetical protein
MSINELGQNANEVVRIHRRRFENDLSFVLMESCSDDYFVLPGGHDGFNNQPGMHGDLLVTPPSP